LKATRLTQSAMGASPGDREAMIAEAQALRARSASVGRVILILLMGAAIAMSIGRYM
jgi:hypothetical protein